MKLLFESPVNNLSLGNIGYNLLREFYKRDYTVGFFPIGQTDLSAFAPEKDFVGWLQESVNRRYSLLKSDTPCIKNWHLQGSDVLRTNKQLVLTYHETSQATPIEVVIANLQHKTLFCGGYSEGVFKKFGAENVGSFNLGFDEDFKPTGKKYLSALSWGLSGKFESRKSTAKIIQLWVKKYGNNKDHCLNLLVNNPFFSPEDNQRLIQNSIGQRTWNVNILPRLATNKEVNEYICATDIDLTGISGNESWNFPAFNATAMGKWSVVTASMGNLAWANEENSIMIQPSGMRPSHDGVFFKNGGDFSQGEFYDVSDEAIIEGFERAEKKAGQTNECGLTLQKTFLYSNTVDQILANI